MSGMRLLILVATAIAAVPGLGSAQSVLERVLDQIDDATNFAQINGISGAVTAGRMYVQVGVFGDASNAARSVQRLQGLGLPVAKSRITSKGRNLQIVRAGPFGDAGSAKAALLAARRAGFGDAFIRYTPSPAEAEFVD